MNTRQSNGSCLKSIAAVTAAAFFGFSVASPVFAFESDPRTGETVGQVFGLALTGNLDFSNLSVKGVAYKPVNGLSGSTASSPDSFFAIEDGVATTRLPLLTFGDEVRYPGILYDRNGTQFFEHVAGAAAGESESQGVIWPYILGGAVLVGTILVIATNNSDDSPEETPVVDEETVTPEPAPTEEPAADPVPPAEEPAASGTADPDPAAPAES